MPSTLPKSSPLGAVALHAIAKSYDGRPVIRNLSLDVASGEFLAIVGPSGSGKTTLMRIVGGFEAPESGRVEIAGEDVTDLPAERRNVSTVFQSYALFPHLSVLDNVGFGPRMRGLSRAEQYRKANDLLELVQLADAGKRMPHELSGGMQQRVALARALANDPAVLLLDEPLGALDRKLREEMQRELRRVQGVLGATFIYVTHDQDEAFGMADRLAVMRDGRIEQIGDPAAVYDQPANAWVALFVGSANSFAATIGGPGARSRLATDFGSLVTEHVAPDLRAGERGVVVVRPEATRIEAAESNPASDRVNRIAATLVDRVAVGPALRLRAKTASGQEFEAVMGREGHSAPIYQPGDAVVVAFDAAATRVYRPEPPVSKSLLSISKG